MEYYLNMNTTDILDENELELEQEIANSLLPDSVNPDTLIDDSDPLEVVNSKMIRERLKDILMNELTARERATLDYRFGLADGNPMTLNDVGKRFSVTGQRIRQLEAKALRKLRHRDRIGKTYELIYGDILYYSC